MPGLGGELPLRRGDALLIVDVQRDFCEGGALAVRGGDEVVRVLNRWIDAAAGMGLPVFASRDWHPPGHVSFEPQGGPWPPHCVQETPGAAFHPDLALPEGAIVLSKGTDPDEDAYSAFQGTGLAEALRERRVERVWMGGLALDVCVRATAQDARHNGFATHLILSATRPVDAEAGRRTVETLLDMGVRVHREE